MRGDINLVFSNLYRIRHHLDALKKPTGREHRTRVQLLYHLYRDNCGDDLARMHALCQELDFELHPILAYLTPLERVARVLNDLGTMTPKDFAHPVRMSSLDRTSCRFSTLRRLPC
ncbi:hypothetical protein [Austwickia chelonae]|uniref:hypothetical protein n=1 Tax=Austwickia chelonae TaxID=100225 RepID=UPI000E225A68|nr:hypothetical protein [Austwickia chelonae]